MSFNSFPIPDTLHMLAGDKVQDKIKDIAGDKQIFDGPMYLTDGIYYVTYRAKFPTGGALKLFYGNEQIVSVTTPSTAPYVVSVGIITVDGNDHSCNFFSRGAAVAYYYSGGTSSTYFNSSNVDHTITIETPEDKVSEVFHIWKL